jgi:hypothetical protein
MGVFANVQMRFTFLAKGLYALVKFVGQTVSGFTPIKGLLYLGNVGSFIFVLHHPG